jgi:hypothetical protein
VEAKWKKPLLASKKPKKHLAISNAPVETIQLKEFAPKVNCIARNANQIKIPLRCITLIQ